MHDGDPHRDTQAAEAAQRLPRVDSAALLGERKRMVIRHGDREYLLRCTRRGKLILTGHEA
jgi:hemin uptake protein HemP